jgi:mono/diheme cytochrome c family protein
MSIGKWMVRGLIGLVGLVVVSAGAVYGMSARVLSAKGTPPDRKAIAISIDAVLLARGRKLTTASGCRECHGPNLGGRVMHEDPAFGRLVAPNLTTGQGGVLAQYDDRQLDAAIRDGLAADGRKLFIMPSAEFAGLADADVAAIIADIRASAAVNNAPPPMRFGPVARALLATGAMPVAYDEIDHARTTLAAAPMGGTVEHGRYLAAGCVGCHMKDFGGGPLPGAAPDAKQSANITPSGNIAKWSQADFIRLFRDGTRPDGTKVDASMPWPVLGALNDEELQGIYLYLRTLPPKVVAVK